MKLESGRMCPPDPIIVTMTHSEYVDLRVLLSRIPKIKGLDLGSSLVRIADRLDRELTKASSDNGEA